MSLADIQAIKILKLLKQNVYNVANLTKTPYLGNYAPIAFRDLNIGGRSNTYVNATSRLQIFPQFTAQDIVLAYGNYYNGVTASPNGSIGNSITVKASIEINGDIIPVTFNGNRTVTITSPNVVMSDPVPCIINSSDTVYIRTYYNSGGAYEADTLTVSTGASTSGNVSVTLNGVTTNIAVAAGDSIATVCTKIAGASYSGWAAVANTGAGTVTFTSTTALTCSSPTFSTDSTGVTGSIVRATSGITAYVPQCNWMWNNSGVNDGFISGQDYTDSGTFSGNTFVQSYTPQWIVGASPTKRDSVLLLGDSIISGTNDEPQTAVGRTGFASRALTQQGIGWNKISMGGEKTDGCLASLYVRRPYFNYHNKVIVNYARNDLNATCTLSPIQGWLLKIWQYLSGLGLTVYQTTIAPSTTSSDYFTSLVGQTLQSGNTEPVRLQLNAWLRDSSSNGAVSQSNGALYKVLDVAQTIEDTATGKWKVYNNGNPIFTGTVTSATSGSITCSSLPYASRALDNNAVIKITGGTGAGQWATVNNNYSPATLIAINGSFSTIPDSTSTFALYTVPTYDGVHPCVQAHIDMSAVINL